MTEITAEDIADYVNTQDDFGLELFAYRELLERGIQSEHGGTYIDANTGKPRQFDIRASMRFGDMPWILNLAVECKSLSKEAPLVVSRVPRPVTESVHHVIHSWGRLDAGERFHSIMRSTERAPFYGPEQLVGKNTFQLARSKEQPPKGTTNQKPSFKKSDSEAYEKWSQALSSSATLVDTSTRSNVHYKLERAYTLVLPILVVSDQTLWAVDYNETGQVTVGPHLIDNCELYVGREYPIAGSTSPYEITHLHIFTRTGYTQFLTSILAASSRPIERMFGFTLRQVGLASR